MADTDEHEHAPGWRDVFSVPGFLPVYVALSVSTWGDYLARLAIAAVVYEWTRSPLATASTLAVSLLPSIFGRSLLSPLVDRVHYRSVIVIAALSRALSVLLLLGAVQAQMNLSVLLLLLFVLELFGGPAATASQVMWTERIPDRRVYVRAMGLQALSEQANQAIGLAVGGLVIGLLGVRTGLLFDLVTFLLVAVVVLVVVEVDRPPRPVESGRTGVWTQLRTGASVIAGSPVLGRLFGLGALASLGISPAEAVAIPYAGDARLGGLLMSAPIVGAAVGVLVVSRWSPETANRRIIVMALLMPLPLLLSAFQPGLGVTWGLWFLSGTLQAFMLPVQSTFALVSPRERRGTMIGLAASVSVASSGVAYLVAGWLTEHTTPYAAVTVCAVVCLGGTILFAATWPRRQLRDEVSRAYAGETTATGLVT